MSRSPMGRIDVENLTAVAARFEQDTGLSGPQYPELCGDQLVERRALYLEWEYWRLTRRFDSHQTFQEYREQKAQMAELTAPLD